MSFDEQGGDWPATNRDIQAVRKHIFEVEGRAKERDMRFANMLMEVQAHLVPGLRSAWTGRLAMVALVASFIGAVLGAVTVRAATADAQASEVRR